MYICTFENMLRNFAVVSPPANTSSFGVKYYNYLFLTYICLLMFEVLRFFDNNFDFSSHAEA